MAIEPAVAGRLTLTGLPCIMPESNNQHAK